MLLAVGSFSILNDKNSILGLMWLAFLVGRLYLEWYHMAWLVVIKKDMKNNMCYNNMGSCAHIIDIILGSIVQIIGMAYVMRLERERERKREFTYMLQLLHEVKFIEGS